MHASCMRVTCDPHPTPQLPVMAAEFLILMVILEKTWFTPVGAVLDKRDAEIREKLMGVKVSVTTASQPLWSAPAASH
jgi:F0F1-type ATP synthase membrane subunit b/b'